MCERYASQRYSPTGAKRVRWVTALAFGIVGVIAGVAGPTVAGAGQGSGNPALTVANPVLPVDRPGTVTVTGTDYLVPPHAPGVNVFGGVYVFFGWIRPGTTWGPSWKSSTSNDGNFGVTYHYAGDGGDASTRDDGSGHVRLVAFTAGGESGNASPFHMDDAGNWSTTITVDGPTYRYKESASGRSVTVDCRTVVCGIFTIGAHGKASRTNERFTPVLFAAAPAPTSPATPTPPTAPAAGGSNGTPTTAAPAAQSAPSAAASSSSTSSTSTTSRPRALPDTGTASDDSASRDTARAPSGPVTEPPHGSGIGPWPWLAGGMLLVGGAGAMWWYRSRRLPRRPRRHGRAF